VLSRCFESHPAVRRVRRRVSPGIVGAMIGWACAGVVSAPAHAALPDAESMPRHVGKIVGVELVTPNLAAAEAFYAGLLGWTFVDSASGGLHRSEASTDGRSVAALVERTIPAGARIQPAWLTFIAVRDVDAAQKTALRYGAHSLAAPHEVPGRGREAVLADPQGAVFALRTAVRADPAEELPDPGEWIWSSLFVTDVDADVAFYQSVFDYEVFDVSADSTATHLILASEDYARASANKLPASPAHGHPHWLNYVRVTDADQAVARVIALGGRVLVQPRVDRSGGKVAVVSDPQGAPFGLLEWSSEEQAQAHASHTA
jgi:predicted enzyme related to lactoylglutathione lyase